MVPLFQHFLCHYRVSVTPVNFTLRLNDSAVALASVKSVIVPSSSKACTSLQYCHKITDPFK